MKELFSMDLKDYKGTENVFVRPSARALIERNGELLLIYSNKYDYYKCPGGGIEAGESPEDALIREVREETGFDVIPESIKEFGSVSRRQLSKINENVIFEQMNYYFTCEIKEACPAERALEDYEIEGEYVVRWAAPIIASRANHYSNPEEKWSDMVKREEKVFDIFDIEKRRYQRKLQEQAAIEDMISKSSDKAPDYKDMLDFVESILEDPKGEERKGFNYSRFEHTKHVLGWARKLYEVYPYKNEINYEDTMIATIFHDVGRRDADALNISHAQAGVSITENYLIEHNYPAERAGYIASLVGRHSDKQEIRDPNLDKNLLLLMEADLLDDSGTLGLVMDCMITVFRNPSARFTDALDHIMRFSHRIQQENELVTDVARKIWDEKTALVNEFCNQFQKDVEM